MKLVGIVGRAYYNRDNQKIMQVNEAIRKALSSYDDVCSVVLLPTKEVDYVDLPMGLDEISSVDREKLDYMLEKCDAFIVPGGTSWYCFDEYVIKYALEQQKPILAICAGFQAVCSMDAKERVAFDMTKHFSHDKHYGDSSQYIHSVLVVEKTLLKDIVGLDKFLVNSVHHDYVDFELNQWVVSAYSEDGVVEAVEFPDHVFALGVQWHPEYLRDEIAKKIFDCFIQKIKS